MKSLLLVRDLILNYHHRIEALQAEVAERKDIISNLENRLKVKMLWRMVWGLVLSLLLALSAVKVC